MQRRDLAIVLVGALLVAGATAYAAVQPGAQRFALTYVKVAVPVSVPLSSSPLPTTGFAYDSKASVSNSNVTRFFAQVNVSSSNAVAGATAHATLTMPNGTKIEKETSMGTGGGLMTLVFDVPVATLPEDAVIEAASQAEAERHLVANASGAGTWDLSISVSPTTLPAASFDVTEFSFVEAYAGAATPLVPNAK